MPIPWGDHLDLARCVAVLGEDDLREATTAMGRCLFHLAPGTGKADAQPTGQLGTKFDEGGVLNRGHRNQPGTFSIR